jgi:hypothetical protein
MKVELTRSYRFEAAHRLPMVPADHKCARMHGHSFEIEVTVAGEIDSRMGWLVDYADITKVVAQERARPPFAQRRSRTREPDLGGAVRLAVAASASAPAAARGDHGRRDLHRALHLPGRMNMTFRDHPCIPRHAATERNPLP